jgi:hypothetical protein
MDEGRKRVLLIAASILAARRLVNCDGRPSPVLESAIADAIAIAESGSWQGSTAGDRRGARGRFQGSMKRTGFAEPLLRYWSGTRFPK